LLGFFPLILHRRHFALYSHLPLEPSLLALGFIPIFLFPFNRFHPDPTVCAYPPVCCATNALRPSRSCFSTSHFIFILLSTAANSFHCEYIIHKYSSRTRINPYNLVLRIWRVRRWTRTLGELAQLFSDVSAFFLPYHNDVVL
jgi:hypothetical protein